MTNTSLKRNLFTLLCTLLSIGSALAQEPIRVACIGNSVTYGYGHKNPAATSYPTRLGEMLGEGLAQGISNNASSPLSALSSLSEDMLDEVEGMNGLTLQRRLEHTFSGADASAGAAPSGLLAKLDSILAAIERGQILTIDGTTLVGSTISTYDNKLGQRRALAARGAL